MRGRGLDLEHSTVFRRVQRYAPEINKRIRPHLKTGGTSHRVDETYTEAGKTCRYVSRAVDEGGGASELMLGAGRDVRAARRFFKKVMRAGRGRVPSRIAVDKNAG